MASEPPQLDSTRATDQVSGFVLGHVMESLLRRGPGTTLLPGVAQTWEITPTGATFRLRDNARWSDGQPVTARDFVFAWRKIVDPANASEYAFFLYPLKNAEAINRGELPIESLGVRAVDDRTLVVDFERPTPYFDKLVVYATYGPVRQDFYESRNGRYGADADTMLYNGPFRITTWVHGAHLRLEKNPYYWDRGPHQAERHRHAVRHQRSERGAESVQGRQDRDRAAERRNARRCARAPLEDQRVRRRLDLLHRIQPSPRPHHDEPEPASRVVARVGSGRTRLQSHEAAGQCARAFRSSLRGCPV